MQLPNPDFYPDWRTFAKQLVKELQQLNTPKIPILPIYNHDNLPSNAQEGSVILVRIVVAEDDVQSDYTRYRLFLAVAMGVETLTQWRLVQNVMTTADGINLGSTIPIYENKASLPSLHFGTAVGFANGGGLVYVLDDSSASDGSGDPALLIAAFGIYRKVETFSPFA